MLFKCCLPPTTLDPLPLSLKMPKFRLKKLVFAPPRLLVCPLASRPCKLSPACSCELTLSHICCSLPAQDDEAAHPKGIRRDSSSEAQAGADGLGRDKALGSDGVLHPYLNAV